MADAVAEQCRCAKGADGRCAACLALIGGLVKDLAGLIMESQRKMDETIAGAVQVCAGCARTDLDLALANTVRELALDKKGDRHQRAGSIMAAAIKLAEAGKRQGVEAYPLTQSAITEMMAALAAIPPG